MKKIQKKLVLKKKTIAQLTGFTIGNPHRINGGKTYWNCTYYICPMTDDCPTQGPCATTNM